MSKQSHRRAVTLTTRQANPRGSRAGATQSEATQPVAKPFKAVPRETLDNSITHMRSAMKYALERLELEYEHLNDAVRYVQPMSEGPQERPVADPLGDLWPDQDDE